MVGDAGHPGGPAAELNVGLQVAYDTSADMWAEGPEPVYGSLARALLTRVLQVLGGWRLGLAHAAPFVGSLPAARRAELRHAAEAAMTGTGPLVVEMLVLTAR
jgi:hypothetical protein